MHATSDDPVLHLCAAVVEVARRDARAGNPDASDWLDDLRSHLPVARFRTIDPSKTESAASERARAAIQARWRRVA